ncbi:MAG: hypothetical protein L6Q52_16620 [Rhodocyclaceae bacterium]|nr:hypothetical protein [Rhodocyclaceae bacterium]
MKLAERQANRGRWQVEVEGWRASAVFRVTRWNTGSGAFLPSRAGKAARRSR